MKAVFADAFYFVALLNRADQHHSKAAAAARDLRNNLVTTEWVLAEVADALAASASRRLVTSFIRDLSQDPKVKIIPATTDLFQRGLRLYEKRPDKQWSLTDCTSFVTMKDENLAGALTGDEHFAQAGFKALLR
jgi:predicted nucleic acid-binding protein